MSCPSIKQKTIKILVKLILLNIPTSGVRQDSQTIQCQEMFVFSGLNKHICFGFCHFTKKRILISNWLHLCTYEKKLTG